MARLALDVWTEVIDEIVATYKRDTFGAWPCLLEARIASMSRIPSALREVLESHGWVGSHFVALVDRPTLITSLLLARAGITEQNDSHSRVCTVMPYCTTYASTIDTSFQFSWLESETAAVTELEQEERYFHVLETSWEDDPDGHWLTDIRDFPIDSKPLLHRCLQMEGSAKRSSWTWRRCKFHSEFENEMAQEANCALQKGLHRSVLMYLTPSQMFLLAMVPGWNASYPPAIDVDDLKVHALCGWQRHRE